MKKLNIIAFVLLLIISACKKENKSDSQYANITVVNAAVGAGTVKVNYFGRGISWSAYSGTIGNLNFATSQILTVFNINNEYPFQIRPALDTLNSVVNSILPMEPNGTYSLYATGQVGNYDFVFQKEARMPNRIVDSVVSVRFINLSPNSPIVNITMASNPTLQEFSGLAYKQQTGFKNFSARRVIPVGSLTWEVRDATTNILLTSYTLPAIPVSPYSAVSTLMSRFRNITLVIKGFAGVATGTNAYSVFPVANY